MERDLIRPASQPNPACAAEPLKRALGGGADRTMARGARRALLLGVGGVSLVTGVVGAFVPVLPSTCFLLLAAWCFGRSSPRLYAWMHTNRWFGRYLSDYRAGRGIPRAIKIGSLTIMWAAITATVVLAVSALWLRALLIGIAIAVTIHVATQRDAPTLRDELRA